MDNNLKIEQRQELRVLVFSGSLRKDSLNNQLAKLAARAIEKNGGIADYASMSEFDSPSYNQDLDTNDFRPTGIKEFQKRLLANDAFVITSPEYNGSMPGFLKNVIDWTSRLPQQPFNERHALLMSASPSMMGGNRALWALRMPLENLGARVFPDMFSLAIAHKAFAPNGEIGDEILANRFEANVIAFMGLVEAAKNYPGMKKAWVEFLSHDKEVVTERIEQSK